VSLNWKFLRLAVIPAFLLVVAGCSGINTTHSVSPATFLLPGLIQADPSPAPFEHALPADEPGKEVAQS
jgi:hypothetical protein